MAMINTIDPLPIIRRLSAQHMRYALTVTSVWKLCLAWEIGGFHASVDRF